MGLEKTAPGDKGHQGPDAPLAHRSLDIPCQVASPQSLTPFLQAAPVYPFEETVGKYHWTPDLCLRKSRGEAPPVLEPDERSFCIDDWDTRMIRAAKNYDHFAALDARKTVGNFPASYGASLACASPYCFASSSPRSLPPVTRERHWPKNASVDGGGPFRSAAMETAAEEPSESQDGEGNCR
jgi:hypothetical protein